MEELARRVSDALSWIIARVRGRHLSLGYLVQRIRRMHPLRQGLTLVLLLGLVAMPALAVASAYQDYLQLRSLGTDALHHLLAAKDAILPSKTSATSANCTVTVTATPSATPGSGSGSGSSSGFSLPNAAQITTAQHELQAAQQEFGQLAIMLNRPNPTLAFAAGVPSLGGKVTTVRQLVFVGQDVSTMGLSLLGAVEPVLANLRGGALSEGAQPLITATQAAQIRGALVSSIPLLNDLESRISMIDPNQLPVSACQRAEYVHLTAELPQANSWLAKAPQLFDAAMWFAGVGQSRQFLIQEMDSRELRPTGGFTGQYGVLITSNGRVKLAGSGLYTVNHLDYGVGYNYIVGRRPPPIYDWWPFQNWGVRDSNLSPDFPTTAQLVLKNFAGEGGPGYLSLPTSAMDGLIAFTPVPIEHFLQLTGPIVVPNFNETITASNLVAKIDFYQNTAQGQALDAALCHGSSDNTPATQRECFTQILGRLMLNRARHLSFSQLAPLAKTLLGDVQSKEIQIYITNPQMEQLLAQYAYVSRLITTPGIDTLMVAQANVSVSKNTPYINMSIADNVTLDTKGGATHHVTFTLINQVGNHPVDGYTTFRDYVRFYVPQQAKLQTANGFDTGQPVCWIAPPSNPTEQKPAQFASLATCNTGPGFFPDGSLSCPQGYWGPGPRAPDAFGSDGHTDWPVENTGWPTNLTSDVPGLAMYGGFVVVPNLCTARITLTYYVPNVALPSSEVARNRPAYTLIVEHQVSTAIPLTVNVQLDTSVAGIQNRPIHFQGPLSTDLTLTIPRVSARFGGP